MMRINLILLSALTAAPLCILPAHAQFGGQKVATVTAAPRPAAVTRGGKGVLFVTISVVPKYHINAHQPNDSAYIPTEFRGQPRSGITFGAARYPAAKTVKVSYSAKPLLVYTGKVVISIPYTVSKSAKTGTTALAGMVSFQGCDEKSCYPPATVPVSTMVIVK